MALRNNKKVSKESSSFENEPKNKGNGVVFFGIGRLFLNTRQSICQVLGETFASVRSSQ
jgi:hypothetical protein